DDRIGTSSVVINGYDYDFSNFKHPAAGSTFNGSTNPLITGNWDLGGNGASFLFQNITGSDNDLNWYFPCNVRSQYGTSNPNTTDYDSSTNCHTSSTARTDLSNMSPQGQVWLSWDNVHQSNRSLAVYEDKVLDLELLNWLSASEVSYPSVFDDLRHNTDNLYSGNDLTMLFYHSNQKNIGACLQDIITIGFVDSTSIGCLALDVVLYLSLIFIIESETSLEKPTDKECSVRILGLPGLLIVVTSRKVAYVGWMLVYLITLPLWNGLLPACAFWHFDDFSWGQTRMVSGDKGGNHGDKEGEFDSTHIVMKKWAECERERRWKSGTQSRDSTSYEKKAESNRYSLVTDSDTFHPPSNNGFDSSTTESSSYASLRQRHDSNTLLMLPAPLSVNRQPQPPPMASSSSLSVNGARSSEEHQYTDTSSSNLRLIPSFQSQSDQQHLTDYDASPAGIAPPSRYSSPGARSMESPQPRANFRSPTGFSDVSNPFSTTSPVSSEHAFTAEPDEMVSPGPVSGRPGGRTGGVRLTDGGPVPGPEGVRRVARPTGRRPQSQNRYSRNSTAFSLPPGAAPPQPNFGSGPTGFS
ncbi:chitin synthase-domain-containing protein, partial [Lentinula aff. detonsa]